MTLGFGGPANMKESRTSGPRKSLLTAVALVALAAGPAPAQTNESAGTPPGGAVETPPPPAPPAPPLAAPLPPDATTPTSNAGEKPANASRTPEGIPAPAEIPSGVQPAGTSWFTRAPLKMSIGSGTQT